jgi:putative ABC transport system permease protein
MNGLIQDLIYGIWMLARSPGVTLVAILTLALGIGLSTAVFSIAAPARTRQRPEPRAWASGGH